MDVHPTLPEGSGNPAAVDGGLLLSKLREENVRPPGGHTSNLALQALVAAYAAKKAIVDESSARAAVTEITAE